MISPRLISIDTSIFGKLAKDFYSRNREKSDRAKETVKYLNESGLTPFITFHHIQEILQHENKGVVFERWSLISKFPTVAWLCSFEDSRVLGSIYDIHQLEVEHLLESPDPYFNVLRNKFKENLIQYCSGESFVEKFEQVYSEACQLGYMGVKRSKEIESISHLQDKKANDTKLSELNNSVLRSPEEVMRYMSEYEKELVNNLESRGDVKLEDSSKVAREFVEGVVSDAQPLYSSTSASLYESFVRNAGVRMDQVTPNTTVGELGYLAVYNSKMRQILKSLNVPESKAKDIFPNDSTTWVIWKYLDNFMKYEKRAHGSNMIDKHMSVLALYVDIFIVDKRVKECFRQLKNRNTVLSQGFGNIIKMASYSELRNL